MRAFSLLASGAVAAGCSCSDTALCKPLTTPPAEKEIFAFATKDSWKSFLESEPTVTTIAFFGTVSDDLICAAHAKSVRVVKGQDFDKTKLLDASARTAWVSKLVDQMIATGLDGYNIDIEGNSDNRDNLTSLVKELSAAMRKANPHAQLSFDLGVQPKGQTAGYAHADLAEALDFIVPMAYGECWGDSPIARLGVWVQQYQDLGVPPSKLVPGLGGCELLFTSANATAKQTGETRYEESSMTAFTEYMDASGIRHQRWFDDVKTLAAKYSEAAKLGVKGVAFWTADEFDYSTSEGQHMWEALGSFGVSEVMV